MNLELKRDFDAESMQPRNARAEIWRAQSALAIITVREVGGGRWRWTIRAARSLPYASTEDFATRQEAWQSARERLRELARIVADSVDRSIAADVLEAARPRRRVDWSTVPERMSPDEYGHGLPGDE